MKAVILSYHSHNVFGGDYRNNDHVAFAKDLELIRESGAKVVPLMSLVAEIRSCKSGETPDTGGEVYVALTFDDGPIFDYEDFIHPLHGHQRSFYNQMLQFRGKYGSEVQPGLSATSFVIASPSARLAMARSAECGYTFLDESWLGDEWWESAAKSGMLSIGNHSWDHVHPAVPDVVIASKVRGSFSEVDTYADANAEIRAAADFISDITNGLSVPLFAFPYGQYNDYLVKHYLPDCAGEHGIIAAFPLMASMFRSRIVCGACRGLFAGFTGNRRNSWQVFSMGSLK